MKIIKRTLTWLEKYGVKLVMGFIMIVVIAGIISASYQKISTLVDERWRYPPPGMLVEVQGRLMHINCTGEGGPTVILDAGMGNSSLIWSWVQPPVARFTRVCSYDRAGLGWSETKHGWNVIGTTPRTSREMAEELHELLVKAGVPGPYVLVGHSLGGMNVRVYAGMYPNEVAGMVLVDSSHEDTYKRLPKEVIALSNKDKVEHQNGRLTVFFGVDRFCKQIDGYRWLPVDIQRTYMAIQSQTETHVTEDDEYLSFVESIRQARSTPRMPDNIPLFVLYATYQYESLPPGVSDRAKQAWTEMQQELASRSKNSVLSLVEQSDHNIHTNCHRGKVVDAIRRVVEAAKNHSQLSLA